jgi:PTS system N-acetylglucosamine-specific IIC component
MVLMEMLGVRLGFGFSAGLFDYLLNFNIATRPLWLLPVGAAYFAVYYAMFRFFIVRYDLPTPGREPAAARDALPAEDDCDKVAAMVAALGGPGNLQSVDACTTRLRLVVADEARVRPGKLKELGAHGVIRPTANAVQVVVGPAADQVAGAIRAYIGRHVAGQRGATMPSSDGGDGAAAPAIEALAVELPGTLSAAFGGAENIRKAETIAGRLRIEVVGRDKLDTELLTALDDRGIVWVSANVVHLLNAEQLLRK